jgi:transposase
MRIIFERVAGLDIHKRTVTATRMRVSADSRQEWETKTFGTTTPELLQLHDWLQAWECSHVAMESTGDYWKPVFNLLEGDFEAWLVNARHVQQVPGRKTDALDAEWLAELMLHGMLRPSFIPPKPQRALRDLTRYRTRLVQERARTVNRVQKLLEGANIKLASVVTDIMGVSARAMLEALRAGQNDAAVMAELARGRLRNKLPELEKALTGLVGAHHRFLLSQQLAHIDFLDEQIVEISAEIARRIEAMSQVPQPAAFGADRDGTNAETNSDQQQPPLTWSEAVTLLDTMPGINRKTAEVILAEIGLDMSQFPTDKQLAAWAGLAPGNHQSGGKRYSGRTRHGNQALKSTLVQAAWSAVRTKDTFLKARFHRLAARRGRKRAIVATAHSMLVSVWHMLTWRQPYQELGGDYFDQRKKEVKVGYLIRRLEKLTGASVTLEIQAPAA